MLPSKELAGLVTVVAGPLGAMDAFTAELRDAEIPHRALDTTHAFHSRMLEPIQDGDIPHLVGVRASDRAAAARPAVDRREARGQDLPICVRHVAPFRSLRDREDDSRVAQRPSCQGRP